MTASRHRRLARTGGHPPRHAPVSKCAPRVNARFCLLDRLSAARPRELAVCARESRPHTPLVAVSDWTSSCRYHNHDRMADPDLVALLQQLGCVDSAPVEPGAVG